MPSSAVKVAISLPREILEAADRRRSELGVSRSRFFRDAVTTLLDREREGAEARAYIAAYLKEPDDDADEVAAARAAASRTLASEPWE